jgi:Uma2 family endonuclease
VSDYYALPDGQRAELIDGVFYDMSAPAYVHQQIIEEIVFQISSYIRKKHGMCQIVPSPVDVRLDRDERTMVQPDAVVVCGDHKDRIRKWGIMGAPDFVLEVLSPRTRRKDLHLKCTKYLTAGVREYWILDPDKRKLLIWRGEESLPELFELSGKVELLVFDEPMMVDLDMVQQLINQNELLEE